MIFLHKLWINSFLCTINNHLSSWVTGTCHLKVAYHSGIQWIVIPSSHEIVIMSSINLLYILCSFHSFCVTVNEIFAQTVDVKDLLSSSVLFENYSSTPSYHKAGKIGGKIAEEFGVDISLNETMQVLLKLGDVMKQEVIWQKLYDKINGKMLKITHPLLKVIKSNKKRSLFLIGMVVTSGLTETINKDMTVSGRSISLVILYHIMLYGGSQWLNG